MDNMKPKEPNRGAMYKNIQTCRYPDWSNISKSGDEPL